MKQNLDAPRGRESSTEMLPQRKIAEFVLKACSADCTDEEAEQMIGQLEESAGTAARGADTDPSYRVSLVGILWRRAWIKDRTSLRGLLPAFLTLCGPNNEREGGGTSRFAPADYTMIQSLPKE